MLKLLVSSATTLISLFSLFTAPVNARQITFGSGNDTITFSTLSYTTYGGSGQYFWITKNGKPCQINWRWDIEICDRIISNKLGVFDEQWDIKSFRLLPNATKAERQFFRFLQTTPWNTYDQGSSFGILGEKIENKKIHFVTAPGSNKVVCTIDHQIFFKVTSVDAPKGYLKTEVCYGKPAYFQLKDLDTSYQSIPAILKKNAMVHSDPYLRSEPKSFFNKNSNVSVRLHPTSTSGIWRIVETKDSYDPTAIEGYEDKTFTATYVSESEIKWITE